MPVGMISGENPRFPSVPGGHEALKRDLDTMGVQHEETQGHYGAPERSFIIYGLPREHLVALGQKYGQEAVIHNEGGKREFIYTAGPNAGKMHPGLRATSTGPRAAKRPTTTTRTCRATATCASTSTSTTSTRLLSCRARRSRRLSAAPLSRGCRTARAGVPEHVAAEPQMTKHEAARLCTAW
jgi:hypothetical protein